MAQNSFTLTMNDKSFLFIGGLKIVVGIIALAYSKKISLYVSRDKKGNNVNVAE